MRFIKLTIAYDGANYVGWQFQSNGISIQEKLERAWEDLTGEQTRITASGRTDSGVHAESQVCSLQSASRLDVSVMARALNAYLPEDIAVIDAAEMPGEFHAIRDAIAKTYRYQIQSGPVRNVLHRKHWWYVPPHLDFDAMQLASRCLIGKHDFAAFQTTGSDRKSTVRTIHELRIDSTRTGSFEWFNIFVTADGFLYNMVRCIAGTLANVGKGKEPPESVAQILASADRMNAGPTAPPHGLFLIDVQYPQTFSSVSRSDWSITNDIE